MCGIVGLFLKNSALEPQLGSMLAGMLGVMCDRGPDSAGFAVYGSGDPDHIKLTLRSDEPGALAALSAKLSEALGIEASAEARDSHLVLRIPSDAEADVGSWLAANRPGIAVVGTGTRMEIFKEVGLPTEVASRFGLAEMRGTHGIGHTRMATESAVTTRGAHPFSTGADQCLVHNGSLSNHNDVRRELRREGISFETDNDSEVAAGYLTWRLREATT
jgi:glutamate synthase domain-containing protein 1